MLLIRISQLVPLLYSGHFGMLCHVDYMKTVNGTCDVYSPAAMVVYLDLEYIVFFFAEYCCPDPLFEDSGGCGGVTLGQF